MRSISTAVVAVGLVVRGANAILANTGSPCGANCGNVLDATTPADLVCDQSSYANPTGQLFTGCVDCQRGSTFHTGNDSDTQDMLYNLRYTLSYCLWGDAPVKNPQVSDTPCITSKACGPFKPGTQYKNLSTEFDAYQYCDAWETNDSVDFQGCTECLQAEGRQYLANFVIALQAGCVQKPAPGLFIGLNGEIFSTTQVNITAASPTASVDPAWFDHGPLNLGAKVGIAVGGFVVLLILVGAYIVLNGKRRRRAFLRRIETDHVGEEGPEPGAHSEMGETRHRQAPSRGHGDTPMSQRPLRGWDDTPVSQQTPRGWDDSPMSATGEKPFTRYFSPYASQYNSPISPEDNAHMQWPQAALDQSHQIGVATSGEASTSHWGVLPEVKGKGKAEAYELHEVESSESGSSKGHRWLGDAEDPVPQRAVFNRDVDVSNLF